MWYHTTNLLLRTTEVITCASAKRMSAARTLLAMPGASRARPATLDDGRASPSVTDTRVVVETIANSISGSRSIAITVEKFPQEGEEDPSISVY